VGLPTRMLRIRKATIEDVRLLHTMILEFADFEKIRHEVTITEKLLARDGFGDSPRFHTLMAEWSNQAAGYAMYFPFYSSFFGPGLFLEDVYVFEAFRSRGVGKALMAEVASAALEAGFAIVRWEVLDWNQNAIDFYRKLGAAITDEWKPVLLEGDALKRLASARLSSATSSP